MPSIFAPIAVFLAHIIRPLISRAFLSLGMGVISYFGFDSLLNTIKTDVISAWNGLPADMLSIFSLMGADKAITIILSSYIAVLSLKITGSAVKSLSFLPDTGS